MPPHVEALPMHRGIETNNANAGVQQRSNRRALMAGAAAVAAGLLLVAAVASFGEQVFVCAWQRERHRVGAEGESHV